MSVGSTTPFQDGQHVTSDGPFIVIGATGFLGAEIVLQLRKRNRWAPIVIPQRRSQTISGLHPRLIEAQLPNLHVVHVSDPLTEADLDACVRVAEGAAGAQPSFSAGCDATHNCAVPIGLFHVAGDCHTCSGDVNDIIRMRIANEGLADVIFNYVSRRDMRTVYASCAGVVGCQFLEYHDYIAHDDAPPCVRSLEGIPHLAQKAAVEAKWLERAKKGRAPIIFLRPSHLFGPGDDRVQSTRLLAEMLHGLGPLPMLWKPLGGISCCDVRDVATAFIRAMLSPTVSGGTAMNLTAVNLPFSDFVALVEDTLRISVTSLIPYRWTPTLPALLYDAYHRLPTSTRHARHILSQRYFNVSCQRAKLLLQWDPRDIEETIEDTARYLVQLLGVRGEEETMKLSVRSSLWARALPTRRRPRGVGQLTTDWKSRRDATHTQPHALTEKEGVWRSRKRLLVWVVVCILIVTGFTIGFA